MPEGPSKRPRESPETAAEETADVEPAEEPPALEQADEDLLMTDAAHLERAPMVPSAAPAAHMPGATDTSGMYSLRFDTGDAPTLASLLTAFVSSRMPRGGGRVDPRTLVTPGKPASPPPRQEDAIPRAGASGAAPDGDAPGHGFLMDFASVEEFLAFSHAEMAASDASLSLVDNGLFAREPDLAARDEAVRAQEKQQTAEDMMLMVREARVAEQEGVLMRLSDLQDR